MTSSHLVEKARRSLRDAEDRKSDKAFESVLDELEDELLLQDEFPDDHFEVLRQVLADEALFRKPGAWRVPMSIYHDRDKLTAQQRADLLSSIVENYASYRDEELCLTAADLVARSYPVDAAINALRIMSRADNKECRSGVGVALNALACNVDPSDPRLTEIKRLYLGLAERT
jgi:hypothetical protein